MTIADKLTLLANTKEALRAKLNLAKSVPFSKYPDYVNWNTAPSIPNKAFYADFTNDRYVKDGVPCSFKDLFTFTRAGKAWLLEDNEIKDYLADIPRVTATGLLIENESTNMLPSTEYWAMRSGQIRTKKTDGVSFNKGTASDGLVYIYPSYKIQTMYSFGVWAYSLENTTFTIVTNSYSDMVNLEDKKITKASALLFRNTATHVGFYLQAVDITVVAAQLELGGRTSTPIITDRTPVTRPADFLTIDAILYGATITGDWDSTLTLSIVDGKLTHSGYGIIRSFEITVPKMFADFTNNIYVLEGKASSFAELFDFNRAGKAWLVKDTGLQEYEADVPRLDDGLLIEQSATNFILQSQNMSDSYWYKGGVTVSGNNVRQDTSNTAHKLSSPSRIVPQYNHTRSQTLLIKPNNTRYLGLNAHGGLTATGSAIFDLVSILNSSSDTEGVEYLANTIRIKKLGNLLSLSYVVRDNGSWSTLSNSVFNMQFYKELSSASASRSFVGDGTTNFEVMAVDAKEENQVSSMIPTTTTPVTRPADFLLNKITGTTITGDWDSTLTLSIVAGELVHSGYGKIHLLEIN